MYRGSDDRTRAVRSARSCVDRWASKTNFATDDMSNLVDAEFPNVVRAASWGTAVPDLLERITARQRCQLRIRVM